MRPEAQEPLRRLRLASATARGRRLLFVAGLAPGVLLVVFGAEVRQSPGMVLGGVGLVLAAIVARRFSERLTVSAGTRTRSMPPELEAP